MKLTIHTFIVINTMTEFLNINCDNCGRSHTEEESNCKHSLCFTCNNQSDCGTCKQENKERERINNVKECCICMEELSDIKNKVITNCGHVFCLTCILTSYNNKNSCPVCRTELLNGIGNSKTITIPNDFIRTMLHDVIVNMGILDFNDTLNIISQGVYLRFIFDHVRDTLYTEYNEPRNREWLDTIINERLERRQRRRRERRCGICRQTGHDRRRCPNN